MPIEPRGGLYRGNFISVAAVASVAWPDVHHSGLGENFGAALLRQVKIVLVQRVFGAVAATHHAAATGGAGGALRAFAAEIGIRKSLSARLAFGRLKDGHVGPVIGFADARRVSNLLQQAVGRPEDLVLGNAQHARGLSVVLRHLRFPPGQVLPRSVVPNFIRRPQQSAGVSYGSAAYGTAMQNGDMAKKAHVEEAAQRQIGPPEPAMKRPVGMRQVLRGPAAAHLHDRDAVSLLDQPVRGDAASET